VIVPSAIGAADTAGADSAAANGAADLGEPRRTFAGAAFFGRPVGAASLSAAVSTIVILMDKREKREGGGRWWRAYLLVSTC
jgi:hypothetical protein